MEKKHTQMEICMKEIFRTIKNTDSVNLLGRMVKPTLVIGKIMRKTAVVKKQTLLAIFMKEVSWMEKNTDSEKKHRRMAKSTKESGRKMNGFHHQIQIGLVNLYIHFLTKLFVLRFLQQYFLSLSELLLINWFRRLCVVLFSVFLFFFKLKENTDFQEKRVYHAPAMHGMHRAPPNEMWYWNHALIFNIFQII